MLRLLTKSMFDAVQKHDHGMLRQLLSAGGDPNVIRQFNDDGSVISMSLLQFAVSLERVEAVEALLDHKADPEFSTESVVATPLMMSAQADSLPILQLLLDAEEVDINTAQPETGFTAFHYACFAGNQRCALALLGDGGCDADVRTLAGHTGPQLAGKRGHKALMRVLLGAIGAAERKPRSPSAVTPPSSPPPTVARQPTADELLDAIQGKGQFYTLQHFDTKC